MDGRDVWKLADHLNVYEISLLLGGYNPSEFVEVGVINWSNAVNLRTYPFLTAIQNAVATDGIRAEKHSTENAYGTDIDWTFTLIEIESLSQWLTKKNATGLFFSADEPQTPGFADNTNPFYAPKLAAAVQAWTEVTRDPVLLKSKAPKAALDKWLREHAAEFGLTNDNGNPNNQGIGEICKIANWKPEGGATPTSNPVVTKATSINKVKTVGGQVISNPTTRLSQPSSNPPSTDDECPF